MPPLPPFLPARFLQLDGPEDDWRNLWQVLGRHAECARARGGQGGSWKRPISSTTAYRLLLFSSSEINDEEREIQQREQESALFLIGICRKTEPCSCSDLRTRLASLPTSVGSLTSAMRLISAGTRLAGFDSFLMLGSGRGAPER